MIQGYNQNGSSLHRGICAPGWVEQVGIRVTSGGAAVVLNKQTFWVAVLSSARQVARFLEHWPSCIAAAWSVTVGTAALADATILLQG